MINTGDIVYGNINYRGGLANGQVQYFDDRFEFTPHKSDNLLKGLSADSDKQCITIAYRDIVSAKKVNFLFIRNMIRIVIHEEGKEEVLVLTTQKRNDVADFLGARGVAVN